jgi:hypothetical protein
LPDQERLDKDMPAATIVQAQLVVVVVAVLAAPDLINGATELMAAQE